MAIQKKIAGISDKRLTRSESNRILGGVCAGLAEFFSVDSGIVRLIFVLITLFGGSGVLLYLILWLVVPTETSAGVISEEKIKKVAGEIKDRTENSKYVFGIIVLCLGVLFLFDNFGFFRLFNLWKFWPAILIIIGVIILSKKDEN